VVQNTSEKRFHSGSDGTLIGVVTLVLGLLLSLAVLGVPRWASQSINLIVGIVLLIMGALQVAGR
jgi:uncharacterized membrane protein HdeD (DUF308 family)